MTTRYGFLLIQPLHRLQTCELACKDYKDLTPDVSFRRIYEYAGDGREDNGVWRTSLPIISPFVQPLRRLTCTKVCPSGAMHKR